MEAQWKAGFLGCGNMGGALARAAAAGIGGARVLAADHHPEKLAALQRDCGLVPADEGTLARESRFLFLGVKPQVLAEAAASLRAPLAARPAGSFVVVSMAAGVSAARVSELLGGVPVIRIMPNTPAAVGEGVILYCAGEGVTAGDEADFLTLLSAAGLTMKLAEEKFDAASALSGCGPAFMYLFLEGLVDGGVRCGLPRALAQTLALQTALGSARLALDTGRDMALLRGDVCSPAGSTIEGVAALEAAGTRSAALEAVTAAYRRTTALGK